MNIRGCIIKLEKLKREFKKKIFILNFLKRKTHIKDTQKDKDAQPEETAITEPLSNQTDTALELLLNGLISKQDPDKGTKAKINLLYTQIKQTNIHALESTRDTQLKELPGSFTRDKIQEILDLLDERLAKGEISEKTYREIRLRWKKKLVS